MPKFRIFQDTLELMKRVSEVHPDTFDLSEVYTDQHGILWVHVTHETLGRLGERANPGETPNEVLKRLCGHLLGTSSTTIH